MYFYRVEITIMLLYIRLIRESIHLAITSLLANRIRTILSLLGITIGIFSIISVFSIFDSLENTIKSEISSLGNSVLFIQKYPWSTSKDYPWWKYAQRPQISLNDLETLQKRSLAAEAFAYMVSRNTNVHYGSASKSTYMSGISHDYNSIMPFNIAEGRYFTAFESKMGSNVIIVGASMAEDIFEGKNPIGKEVKIMGKKLIVIGVLEKSGNSVVSVGDDNSTYVPLEFARKILNFERLSPSIFAKPKAGVSEAELMDELIGIMRSARKQKPTEEDNFSINKMDLLNQTFDKVFGVIAIVGWVIGGFALLVGGFGIANIMFVSVKERTNQIGIQKALGAKNYFVLLQFLFEAVFLAIMGGTVGLLIVFILATIATLLSGFSITLSIQNILLGLSVSGFIGLVSGFVPAWSASKLDPVEAMRSTF